MEGACLLIKRKIWVGAGVVAAALTSVATVHQAAALTRESGETGTQGDESGLAKGSSGERGQEADSNSFERLLRGVFNGEGGQDGLGISPLRKSGTGWAFSVPALTGGQVKQAVAGNSLRSENHFAVYFSPDGQFRGWALSWAQGPKDDCTSRKDPNRVLMEGQCWIGADTNLSGSWTIKDDTLCLNPSPRPVTDGKQCVRAAIVLNSVLFFGSDGKMVRKGSDLRKGLQLARTSAG
jgi:hypothetical protein